ncbi:MAG: hypothetical protein LQ352_001681 [Teloschistes flavicans]|nr:MAG: hypothetical protein LQ352_001681 [Teloschistes flavicans]
MLQRDPDCNRSPIVPPNPSLPTTTYNVPNTNIRITLRAQDLDSRTMHRADIENLIGTGLVALDLLAARAGGPEANLNVPRIRWAISGLVIRVSDDTRQSPEIAGGPFRFDELKAVYEGMRVALRRINDLECILAIWRVSGIFRRQVKFLGHGYVDIQPFLQGIGSGNLTTA